MGQIECEFKHEHFRKDSIDAYVPAGRSRLFQSGQRCAAGSVNCLGPSVAKRLWTGFKLDPLHSRKSASSHKRMKPLLFASGIEGFARAWKTVPELSIRATCAPR